MVFGSRQNLLNMPPVEVRFRGELLRPEPTVRNLGVIFDPCLSWDAHVAHVVRKCFGLLIGLSHIRHYLPHDVIPTIVHGLVLSHVRYCISSYGNTSDGNHKQLQRVINFCARVVAGRRKFDHISDVLSGPSWLTSKQLSDYHSLVLAQRTLRWEEPASLAALFSRNDEHRSRKTRRDGQFHLPRIRTETGRRQYAYRVPQLYNRLPVELTVRKIGSFKRNLKRFLKKSHDA